MNLMNPTSIIITCNDLTSRPLRPVDTVPGSKPTTSIFDPYNSQYKLFVNLSSNALVAAQSYNWIGVHSALIVHVIWLDLLQQKRLSSSSHIINQDRDIESIEFLGDALVSFDRGVLTEVKHNHSGLSTVSSLDLLCNSGKFVCVPGDQHNVESTFCQFQSKSLTDSVS
eukprot:403331200